MPTRVTPRAGLLPALLVLLAVPLSARAQQPVTPVGVFAGVEHYTFADGAVTGLNSITLITTPFALQAVPTRAVQLLVSGAFAHGSVERDDGTTASLAGLTDTEIRATFAAPRYVSVSAALLVPTGRSTHTAEEAQVAGVVAADLLPFRVSNWGSGGGVDVSASVAAPAGPFNIGARVGYQLAREFEPLDEQPFLYRPGNQLYGRLAVDYNVGRSGKASAHLTVQQFSADEFDGRNLYQSGNRVQLIGSYAFLAGARTTAVLYAGGLHRARPTVFGDATERPTQNLLLAGGGLRMPTNFGALAPSVDVRVFRSEDGLNQGYAAGVGTAAEVRLGGSAVLAPSVRGRIGRIVASEGEETGLFGIDVGIGVRLGRARIR